jgi:transcription elongation GreA/GreB family factor
MASGSGDEGVVNVGSRVRVRDRDGEAEFTIVAIEDANAFEERISADCPLARGRFLAEASARK